MFAYLKRYGRSSMVFDDSEPMFDTSKFTECDWLQHYPDVEEVLPLDAPKVWRKPVTTACYINANYAGCCVMQRLQTGVIIFLNRAPILWYLK